MNKRILVVGELNVDLILNHIDGIPVIGEEILAQDLTVALGSSSAIFASNISVLGIETSFCGRLGNDSFGRFILDELKKKNVDTNLIVQSDDLKTGLTVVLNYDQDRANVTYCGAMAEFNQNDVPYEKFKTFDHLHFSSFFLQNGIKNHVPDLFRKAKENGLSTSLDLQWDPENKWEFPYKKCLPYVDLFLLNEYELLSLTNEDNLEDAISILSDFAHKIIVKRGVKGAVCYEKGVKHNSLPFLHEHFVDAIGAGDSFNAGFVSKYLTGATLSDCLSFGNLSGAINTSSSGGTSAFKDFDSFRQKAKNIFQVII